MGDTGVATTLGFGVTCSGNGDLLISAPKDGADLRGKLGLHEADCLIEFPTGSEITEIQTSDQLHKLWETKLGKQPSFNIVISRARAGEDKRCFSNSNLKRIYARSHREITFDEYDEAVGKVI